jgi:hypothetical protein
MGKANEVRKYYVTCITCEACGGRTGVRCQVSGTEEQDSGVRIREEAEEQVSGVRCQVSGTEEQDSGFRIQDSGFRKSRKNTIQESGFRIRDSGFRIQVKYLFTTEAPRHRERNQKTRLSVSSF